jgi:uncharacterized protein YndB with AHSA1/START domain
MEIVQIEQAVLIEATSEHVFEALTSDVGAWWSHRFSAEAREVRLEPWVGGRFHEAFGANGEGALYATITYIKHGEVLRLSGPMGMPGPVVGVIGYTLEPQGGATLLKLSHRIIGHVSEEQRQRYTDGWRELLDTRLKVFVEQGVRYDPAEDY